MAENPTRKQIDLRYAPALKVLARDGLSTLTRFDIRDFVLFGESRPDLTHFQVGDDGSLTMKTELSPHKVRDVDPSQWEPSIANVTLPTGCVLVIDEGGVSVSGSQISPDGSSPTKWSARLYGWSWHVDSDPNDTRLWASRLRFPTTRMPIVLWWPVGNLSFSVDGEAFQGWQFEAPSGPIFLVRRDDDWFIALATSTPPTKTEIISVLSALGFVFGEEFGVGVFHSIGESSVGVGMLVALLAPIGNRSSRQAPALPMDAPPSCFATFVESILKFEAAEPRAPIRTVIYQYFESLNGILTSQFLHSWIAAEAIATWAIEHGRMKAISQQRIADHAKWVEWLGTHEREIKDLALPGKDRSLFDRVKDSDAGRQNVVQRVFKGEGISWLPEMEDAESARNSIAHEGVMPDVVWNLKLDLGRIGLIRTMLTALIARLVKYTGPIADRAKTHQSIASSAHPTWWTYSLPSEIIVYVDVLTKDDE
jgi:hypothetical protein